MAALRSFHGQQALTVHLGALDSISYSIFAWKRIDSVCSTALLSSIPPGSTSSDKPAASLGGLQNSSGRYSEEQLKRTSTTMRSNRLGCIEGMYYRVEQNPQEEKQRRGSGEDEMKR